ncbi:RnfABCDGE type electron transport complex subunit D [Anaerofilum sp. BX8]|uniref:Ion-translocating oxidoreductase complex subunit D n=1 Tax=Anaerofilum hominis TaxID=2763016 RepID=A0A923I9K3_9FIRM|nr:RnfABCDGE type electron transport complex subunit D [Anaerofilum hominis]MBC5580783.1 RnfABCDGE type electron transport complex subunit D [Anaerofilum hominis]
MEHTNMLVKASPHIRDNSSTQRIMLDVIIALCPAILASGIIFGWRALLLVGVTAAASVAFEYLYCYFLKKPITIGDLSAVVTGILLAFNLPATIPLWIAILGSFVSIVIAKQLFGGLGHNFANPAIVGRIVLAVSFAGRMTAYAYPAVPGGVDALASATPLVATRHADLPLLQLFLGAHGGVLGETCAAALLLGGIYLVVRRVISPAIPVTYLATVAIVSLLAGQEPLVQLLSGGLLLGAIFMATDYVTSPYTLTGKIVYGLGLGVITCAIRFWASSAEGVSYAILLMNLLVPYINDLTRQKPLGGAKKK